MFKRIFLEMRFFKEQLSDWLEICTEYYWIYLLYNDVGYFWLDENERFGIEKTTIV